MRSAAMKCMKTLPVRTGGGRVWYRKNCVFLQTRVAKILQKGLPARTGGGHVPEQRHAQCVESVHSVPVQFGSLAPNSPIPEFQIRPFWSSKAAKAADVAIPRVRVVISIRAAVWAIPRGCEITLHAVAMATIASAACLQCRPVLHLWRRVDLVVALACFLGPPGSSCAR